MPSVEKADRISRSDWLEAGLAALAKGGVHSVRVDTLAKQFGIARSGFYWHFQNRGKLLTAMLEYWTHELTESVTSNQKILSAPPAERLLAIATMVIDGELGRYDEAIRQWAHEDPSIGRHAKRTFALRLDLLEATFAELGFEGEEREMRVRLFAIYQAAEGAAIPPMSKAKRRRLAEIRVRMLTRR
jgi:AcrR family transcriptional regulator